MTRTQDLALIAAAAVTFAGCATQRTTDPAPESSRNYGMVAPTYGADVNRHTDGNRPLVRPDIGPEWSWTGQVLPTGDVGTSVVKVERLAPAEVNSGQAYDYTIRVTNIASGINLHDLMVTDHLPESGYEFQSSTPAGQRVGDKIVWNLGRIAAGQTQSITVHGRATGAGMLMSCASVEYTPTVCSSTNVVTASLAVKVFAPAEVLHCDEIPVRFVVTNPGTGSAMNVRLNDQLPDGWTVDGKRTWTFDVGTLKGGESREVTAVARSAKPGQFETKATVTADGDMTADAAASTIVRRPKLEITSTAGSETQILGRPAVFTINVTNTGDAPARDFVLTDDLNGSQRIVAASDGGSAAGSNVTWNLGVLAPGATRTVTVTTDRTTAGPISLTATARAHCAEPVSSTATIAYVGVPAVLLETVDDPDPVLVGGISTYTITVTNQGTAPDSDIRIECMLEDAVEFVSAAGATRGTGQGGKVTFEPLARLGPKDVAKWTVTIRGVTVGDTRFRCIMNTQQTGRSVEHTEATRVYK